MRVLTPASEVPSGGNAQAGTRPLTRAQGLIAAMAGALLLAGCGTAPNATVAAPPAGAAPADAVSASCAAWLGAQQRGEGRLYRVDAAATQVRLHVFRAGRLAKAGHNHVIGVERLAGQVFVPADGIAGAGLDMAFRVDELVIDKAEWRAALGPEFASTPSASDIAGTRTNLLRAVDGERFPVVTMRGTATAGAYPLLAVQLSIDWHGQTRTFNVPVRVARPSGESPLRAQGALILRQSDFGIAPFSILGGLLAIQDEISVDVDIAARPAAGCG